MGVLQAKSCYHEAESDQESARKPNGEADRDQFLAFESLVCEQSGAVSIHTQKVGRTLP